MTTRPSPADVLAVGLTTPVGLDAPRAAAAVRAGICRFLESSIRNEDGEPLVLSLVGEEYLPDLQPTVPGAAGMTSLRERLLRLATFAVREACAPCAEPPPALLALPEERPGTEDLGSTFARDLAVQAGVKIDERSSRVYREGGAAWLDALRDGLELLAAGRFPCVLVGGVDSCLDLMRLGALGAEGRLAGSSMDGFVPGESAAFLLLGSAAARRQTGAKAIARVVAVGLGTEKGHRYSKEPYLGDGLAEAFQALFAPLPPDHPKVRCVYAGLNGESLPAKEWGVAYLRSAERFADDLRVEHPADCVGDAGAALGPLMLALAAIGLRNGYREGPCLVWSTSDREARGAALIEAA